jgi:hypothetical protein
MHFSWKSAAVSPRAGRCDAAWVGNAPTATAVGVPRRRGAAITACVCAVALLAGCSPHVGVNGVYMEDPRPDLAPFAGIHVENGVSAVITSGAAAQAVRVIGDSNVVPYIETEVELDPDMGGSLLHVRVTEPYEPTIPPVVIVSVPAFRYVRADVAAAHAPTVLVQDADAPAFRVVASGEAVVTIEQALVHAGRAIEAVLASAALDATEYVTSTAAVTLTGDAMAKLHSSNGVTGTAADTSVVNNDLGGGPCLVTKSATATVTCGP